MAALRVKMKMLFLVCFFVLPLSPSFVFGAQIVSITMCEEYTEDGQVSGVKTRFAADTPEIHLLVQYERHKPGTKLKCAWISVDAVETPNYEIDSIEVLLPEAKSSTAHFSLSKPTKGWPPGAYRCDLYFDGALSMSVPFQILASTGSGAVGSTPSAPQDRLPKVTSIVACEQVAGQGMIPVNITETFASDSAEIHVLARLENAKAGTKVKGVWISVDAVSTPDYEIDSSETELRKEAGDVAHFSIARPQKGWPDGNYRFELYLDGKKAAGLPFAVKGPSQLAVSSHGGSVPQFPSAAPTSPLQLDFGPVQADPKRTWTLVFYIDGDNDLEPFAMKDLKELERGLPDEGVECIVLVDRAEGFSNVDGDWQDARVYRVRKDSSPVIKSEVIARAGELNMGDPNVLRSFLSATLTTFPAPHHALILWDHGGGWAAHAIDHNAPGVSGGHDKLTLPKLRQAISEALKKVNLQKLDLIGFDMCLMAQLETASELAGLADAMVASQAVEPGDGWPYDQILPFFGKGTLGTRRLAAQIVEAYGKFYGERKERIATLSAIDLNEAAAMTQALDSLASKVAETIPNAWPDISRSLFYAECYAERTDIRKGSEVLASVDLLDVLNRIRHSIANFPAQQEYQEVVNIMDRAVIAKYASPRHRLSHGLALYAPIRGNQFNREYLQTRIGKDSSWPKLLSALHKAQEKQLTSPRITEMRVVDAQTGKPVTGGKPGGGFRIEATVEGENVLWVQYLQAVRDNKNKGLVLLEKGYVYDPEFYKKKEEAVSDAVDLVMPEFKGNKNKVSKEILGRHLSVTDGRRAARATLDATSLTDLAHVGVPVAYKRQGMEQHFAMVFFNGVTWKAVNVLGEIPQRDGTVAYCMIQPQPDDEVTLLMEFLPDDGKQGYLPGETFKWGNGLELVIDTDEPGEMVVAMRAESIGGQSSFTAIPIRLEALTREDRSFVENAKKVKLKDLVGKWQWHGLKDGQWKAIPPYTEITPSPSNPDVLVAKIHNPGEAGWKVSPMLVLLDTRLMPTLRLISFDDAGQPVEAMNFTMLVSRWEEGSPRMILKYLVPKGWLLLWAKQGPSPASTTPPLSSPPGVVAPPSAPQSQQHGVSLVGVWRGEEGDVIKIDVSTYELYGFNQLVDRGRYEIRGNQLIIRSAVTHDVERYKFKLSGQELILIDSDGEKSRYRRIQ
ncbi:MAG: hypothetical protein GX443_01765 [Deltaproteobacteria bacterium]|nr:hypothetical protein [Deltaproteobacteria bacterium]